MRKKKSGVPASKSKNPPKIVAVKSFAKATKKKKKVKGGQLNNMPY